MRHPSPKMTPNVVRPVRVAFGPDDAAGRLDDPGPQSPGLRCAVQPDKASTEGGGNERDQGVETGTIRFYDDPNLRVRDLVVDERGRTLLVVGVRGTSGGAGRTWLVGYEFRPEPGE